MPAPVNTLKQRLAAGEVLHGLWLALADPYCAEVVATAPFDWVVIDGEHAPNDIRSLSAQFAAIEGKGPAPVVRLVDDNPAGIKQALDIGAQTILIPMIETGEQAERVFRATRYPPEGSRGVGAALARASRFSTIPDYLATAARETCLILQVESRRGLENLDAILAVEGVDGVFIGPSDLAADMGLIGQATHPAVRATVVEALARIRKAGRAAGVLTSDPAFIDECKAAGANFVGVGTDVGTLAQSLRALALRHVGSA